MKSFVFRHENYFRFQTFLLALLGSLFISGTYILLVEVSTTLQWTPVTVSLIFLVSTPFLISFAWIRLESLKLKKMYAGRDREESRSEPVFAYKIQHLSIKERKVLSLITEGKSNKEICSELFIEHSTLKSHINHIYKKLDVKSRKEMTLRGD